MQTSSTTSTDAARPPAPASNASPPGAAPNGSAGGKEGGLTLFSDLMSQAGAERESLQAMQQKADQRAAQDAKSAEKAATGKAGRKAKEPSPDDVVNGLVPSRLVDAQPPARGDAAAREESAASQRLPVAGPAAEASERMPGEDNAGRLAPDGAADSVAQLAAGVAAPGTTDGAGFDSAAGPVVAPSAAADPATTTGPGAAARVDQATLNKAGSPTSDLSGATTATRLAAAAAAGRPIAGAGAGDGLDANGAASRLRRTGRDTAVGTAERATGGRGDAAAAALDAYRTHVANASAEAAAIGSDSAGDTDAASAAQAQAAGVTAAAQGTGGGGDSGLFALTMNQATDTAGSIVADRQEMMAEAMQSAIDVPIDHEGFADAFARHSATLVVQGSSHAEIRLTPQDMGPIRIAISMGSDGALLDIAAGHAETRAAIEASMPQLRQMLADQGVRLSDWRLREEAAGDSRQPGGGEAGRQFGSSADGSRADAGPHRQGAEGMGSPASGPAGGDPRGRTPLPPDRWGTLAPPIATRSPPPVGPSGTGSSRRLDLYA